MRPLYVYTHSHAHGGFFSKATETNIVTCSSNYVNPLKLSGDNDDSESQGGDSTVNMASQRRRRRKRSTEKRKLRYKRQDSTTVDDQDLAINRTLVRQFL